MVNYTISLQGAGPAGVNAAIGSNVDTLKAALISAGYTVTIAHVIELADTPH